MIAVQRRSTHRPPCAAGFALVMVLWVLAGLTVVAVTVAASVQSSNRSVKLLRDRLGAETSFISTAARLQVMASTGTTRRSDIVGPNGPLPVDGRSLAVGPGEWVSVQDVRGLLDLNDPGKRLAGLLPRCGGSEAAVSSLVESLADYVDKDELKRLNGAEAFDYRMVQMPEPRNAPLMTREELWRVKGWPAIKARWQDDGCDGLVSTHGDGRFNPNTAPLAMLEAEGYTPESAAAFVAARLDGLPTLDIQSRSPDSANPFAFLGGGFVGDTLRVRHSAAQVEWEFEYELKLTPFEEGGPWRMLELRYPTRRGELPRGVQALTASEAQLTPREPIPTNAASPVAPR